MGATNWIIVVVITLCGLGSKQTAGRPTQCLTFKETMTTCMGPVGGSPLQPGGGHELLSDLNTTKTLCREGKLQEAMSCLEEVYNECVEQSKARNQQSSDLNLMLDVGKWRRGMEKLCDNVDYLMEHWQCTERMALQSSQCIQRESREFQQAIAKLNKNLNLNALSVEERQAARKNIMDEGCSFAMDVIWCFKNNLDKEASCPCRYRQLVIDVVVESMPPYCKIDTDYYYDEYYLENCVEHKQKQEQQQQQETGGGDRYGAGEDDDDDLEDVQYGGYSIADPSKVKVFEEGEFVKTNLFPGYGHLDSSESENDDESWLQQDPQFPLAPMTRDRESDNDPKMGETQKHKGGASQISSTSWVALSVSVLLSVLCW